MKTPDGWGKWEQGAGFMTRNGPYGLTAYADNGCGTDNWTVTLNGRVRWIAEVKHRSREAAFRACLAAWRSLRGKEDGR